jgi:dimethylargininase
MVRFDNSYAPLHAVLLHRPVEALSDADAEAWGYPAGRDAARCDAEFAAFAALLAAEGVDVHIDEAPVGVDACYRCDPLIPTPFGPIVGRMRKLLRQPENAAAQRHLASLGITPIGAIADGHVEGGDVVWLDADNVLIAVGTRSDHRGADALEAIVGPRGVRVRRVELPWRDGPDVCLHLRSLLNVLSAELAVVLRPWLPTVVLEELAARGIRLLDAVAEEYDSQGNNLLVLRPGVVCMVAGNPKTKAMLEREGLTVRTFAGDELCIKGTGGPTCLCFDLWRAA